MKRKFLIVLMVLYSSYGCSGLDFSHVGPDAENFHPKRIAVLPETVGMHESAKDVINRAVTKALTRKGWYKGVINGEMIKTKMIASPELEKEIEDFVRQMNTQGGSNPDQAARLGDALHADALFITDVTAWEYGREEGSKVCRVGLQVKLVDAANGTVIWKAEHEWVERYWIFKPKINDIADALLNKMIQEMPH